MAVQTGHQLVFEPSWAVIEYELAGSLYTGMKQFWNDIKASGAKDFINPTPEVGSISYHIEVMYFYYLRNGAFYASSSALLAHVKAGKLRAGHRLCVPCCSRQKYCKKRSSRVQCVMQPVPPIELALRQLLLELSHEDCETKLVRSFHRQFERCRGKDQKPWRPALPRIFEK